MRQCGPGIRMALAGSIQDAPQRKGRRDRVTSPDVHSASELYFARIHRAALVLTGNPWDADDLAQETFLILARRGHEFQGRSSLYTLLYGILLNLERRERRRAGM